MFTKMALKYFTYIARSIIKKSNFGKKKKLMACNSRALSALEIYWNVTFDPRFDNNFWAIWNSIMQAECFKSRHSKLEFGHKFWIFLVKNQESYCRLNMAHRVTWNSDSNYVPIVGRKNGSLMFCWRNWICNIFPISQDQSSKN